MIEKLAERGNVLAFRLTGELTEGDYSDNLIPELERALERYPKIRLLLRVEHFRGWKPGGIWEEFVNWPLYAKIERMAIVADESWDVWMSWMVKIYGIFAGVPIRFFRTGRMEDAWDWLEKVQGV